MKHFDWKKDNIYLVSSSFKVHFVTQLSINETMNTTAHVEEAITSDVCVHLLPQQQVNEHSDGEEGASDGGVAAQEEEEVAEKAEEDHPDHVQLKEQVEGVESSRHGAQVLHKSREACRRRVEKTTRLPWRQPGMKTERRHSPSIQSSRHSRQMSSSCHTCSRPCCAVGSRQPRGSSWKNF